MKGICLFLFILILFTNYAYADSRPRSSYKFQSIFQYTQDDNKDLGTSTSKPAVTFSEQFVLSFKKPLDNKKHFYTKLRAYNSKYNTDGSDDISLNDDPNKDEKFLELRELYFHQRMSDYALRIGRQRLREERSLWWNSDNDLIRLFYKKDGDSGFIAAGEDLASYRTDRHEDGDDESRFRVLGEYRYQYASDHFLEPRFIAEYDHSDARETNDIVSARAVDEEDINGLYFGVRAKGKLYQKWHYRSDIIALVGSQDSQNYSKIANTDEYRAGAKSEQNLRAWAMDTDVKYTIHDDIFIKAGYAFASGDKDGGTDTEFRQSGLESGSSRSDLERQTQRNYGEVFRPELSNMHILTAGVSYNPTQRLTVGTNYFYYRQVELADDVRSSGITANPNNKDKTLGHEVDVGATYYLQDSDKDEDTFLDKASVRMVGGMFIPGAAYDEGNDNPSYRLFTELRLEF